MPEERRINVRVPSADFDAYDDKRHKQRTTWQAILSEYLKEWYAGAEQVQTSQDHELTREEESLLDTFRQMLHDDDPTIQGQVSMILVGLRAYAAQAKKTKKSANLQVRNTQSSDKLTGTKSR